MKKLILVGLTLGMFLKSTSQVQVSEKNKSADKWEITPAIDAIEKGKLNVDYPTDALWTILVGSPVNKQTLKYVTSATYPIELTPGDYYIEFTNVPIGIVPFKLGMETRVKTGILDVIYKGTWTIYDKLKKTYYKTGTVPQKIILPIGEYQVKIGSKFYKLVIRDGEIAELVPIGTEIRIREIMKTTEKIPDNPISENILPVLSVIPWEINAPTIKSIENKVDGAGYLSTNFHPDKEWKITMRKEGSNAIYLKAAQDLSSYPVPPGTYYVNLNGVLVENIPIKVDSVTRIKTGLLKIAADDSIQWSIYRKGLDYNFVKDTSPRAVRLPIGLYSLKVKGNYPEINFQIKDRETKTIEVPNTTDLTIEPHMGVIWRILDIDTASFPEQYYSDAAPLFGTSSKTVYLPKGDYILYWSFPVNIPNNPPPPFYFTHHYKQFKVGNKKKLVLGHSSDFISYE